MIDKSVFYEVIDMGKLRELLKEMRREKQEILLNDKIGDRLDRFDALLSRLEIIVYVLEEKFLKE